MSDGLVDQSLALGEQLPKLWRWVASRRFRKVFGNDAGKEYHIVYIRKDVPDRRTVFVSPQPKRSRSNYANATNLTSITSCAIARAMGHLVYSFGKNGRLPPIIDSDTDVDERMDISFISLGGIGNLKTCDLLAEVSGLFTFRENSILRGTEALATADNDSDCAFIIKTQPRSNPERTWLCCAGVGEWGTSGAAWYLARRWKDIRKWAKNRPFAIITKTIRESDESTEPIYTFIRYLGATEFTQLT